MKLAKYLQVFAEEGGKVIYKTGPVYHISATQGTVLSDHAHDEAETIWLISGSAELQIGDEVEQIKAPCEFFIEPNVYHKITALTDVDFVEQRHKAE